jgi:hypothetical protein
LGAAPDPGDELFLNNSGTSRAVTVDNMFKYIPSLTGLGAAPASGDKLFVDDNGTNKSITAANLFTYDLASLNLEKLTAAPGTPVAGEIYYADHSTWDPAGLPGSVAYYCIYDGSDYIALWDEDGDMYISSIQKPAYALFSGADAAYNDTTTPHVLIEAELRGTVITNCGATETRVFTLPTYAFGWDFKVFSCNAQQMDLEPPSGETLYLNSTEAAVDEHLECSGQIGVFLHCYSLETADGTYDVLCDTDYTAIWAEATPP